MTTPRAPTQRPGRRRNRCWYCTCRAAESSAHPIWPARQAGPSPSSRPRCSSNQTCSGRRICSFEKPTLCIVAAYSAHGAFRQELLELAGNTSDGDIEPLPCTPRTWRRATVEFESTIFGSQLSQRPGGLPVVTQDDDFEPLDGAAGLTIIRVWRVTNYVLGQSIPRSHQARPRRTLRPWRAPRSHVAHRASAHHIVLSSPCGVHVVAAQPEALRILIAKMSVSPGRIPALG